MKKLIHSITFAALIFAQQCSFAESLVGKVVGVSDGDTITLLDTNQQQHKIRLTGIDAPEKTQAFGQVSKKSLSDLVFNKRVEILWEKRDRYQRILGKVVLDGNDICLEQVKLGMAWHYKKYQREQSSEDRSRYALAENNARSARLGLWADESPVQPSEFRHRK
jgi:endonuclease YncB( thermonuclease family)